MPLVPIVVLVLDIKTGLAHKLSIILQILSFSSNKYMGTKSKLKMGSVMTIAFRLK